MEVALLVTALDLPVGQALVMDSAPFPPPNAFPGVSLTQGGPSTNKKLCPCLWLKIKFLCWRTARLLLFCHDRNKKKKKKEKR